MYLQLAENSVPSIVTNNYTFVPGVNGAKGVWVKDDNFDNLSPAEFNRVMDMLEPFQPMSEMSTRRRKEKKDLKTEKRKAKLERRRARTELVKAKAEGVRSGTFTPGGAVSDIIGNVSDVASKILNKGGAGGGEVERTPDENTGEDTPFYKKPIVLIGGAVALGLVIFLATRKRKK